jgi:hypothetical protein
VDDLLIGERVKKGSDSVLVNLGFRHRLHNKIYPNSLWQILRNSYNCSKFVRSAWSFREEAALKSKR